MRRAGALRVAMLGVIALHLAFLASSLPDYRVSVDSAYHTALGRQYGEHLIYFWDAIHYAPVGRPNLQGPVVHMAIGALGRVLGGAGDDYVRANAILGLACWLAAVATAAFFAHRLGGERAALLAVAALAGSAFASASFSMNLPSGWMFVFTPWAIHFFLEGRLLLAVGFGALACYSHLGGFATAPLGIVIAALLTRRFRDLVVTGIGVAIATAPYWLHFLHSLAWYQGTKGDTTWWLDPLVDLFWVVGMIAALRSPRRSPLLVAWAMAPLVWVKQDTSRFILQSSLAGAVLGGVAIGRLLDTWRSARLRAAVTAALVTVATLVPLGIPGLAAEATWLLTRYPRILDWREMRADSALIHSAGLEGRMVEAYTGSAASAMTIWSDAKVEKGHWREVRPAIDPADQVGVAGKTYVVELPPGDETLAPWVARGWLQVFGGGDWSAVLGFRERPSLAEATTERNASWARDAGWIAERCERNTLGDPVKLFLDRGEIPRRARARGECRTRVARMQVTLLLYAYALEPFDPERAARARKGALALGWMSALMGDGETLDYRTAEVHERMKQDMARLAEAATEPTGAGTEGRIENAFSTMLERYIGASRGSLF